MKGCAHRDPPALGYMAWIDDAQERHKRGERQKQCPVCGLFIWESFYGPADWKTKAQAGGQCVIGAVSAERKGRNASP